MMYITQYSPILILTTKAHKSSTNVGENPASMAVLDLAVNEEDICAVNSDVTSIHQG